MIWLLLGATVGSFYLQLLSLAFICPERMKKKNQFFHVNQEVIFQFPPTVQRHVCVRGMNQSKLTVGVSVCLSMCVCEWLSVFVILVIIFRTFIFIALKLLHFERVYLFYFFFTLLWLQSTFKSTSKNLIFPNDRKSKKKKIKKKQ